MLVLYTNCCSGACRKVAKVRIFLSSTTSKEVDYLSSQTGLALLSYSFDNFKVEFQDRRLLSGMHFHLFFPLVYMSQPQHHVSSKVAPGGREQEWRTGDQKTHGVRKKEKLTTPSGLCKAHTYPEHIE